MCSSCICWWPEGLQVKNEDSTSQYEQVYSVRWFPVTPTCNHGNYYLVIMHWPHNRGYCNSLLFHCKNIFVQRKWAKIFYVNIIFTTKFFLH